MSRFFCMLLNVCSRCEMETYGLKFRSSGRKWDENTTKWEIMMFLGKYSHTIDSKGRLIIPAKYRDEIGDAKLVVVPWWEENLSVFTQEGFREYVKSLDNLQGSSETRRRIKRFITSGADECRLDAQGRILLNGELRKYAHLSGDVILTGNMDSFEIWAPDVWDQVEEKLMDADEMRNELESLKQLF